MRSNWVSKRDFGQIPFARLDAEYLDPPFVGEEQRLRAIGGHDLSEIAEPKQRNSVRKMAPNKSVQYIDIDSVDTADGLFFPETLRFEDLPSRARHCLRRGDILLSNVRPNRGSVALGSDRNVGHFASSGFSLIRTHGGGPISAECLFAMLKTRYSRNQLIRRNRGSMYPAVVSSDVFAVWIPVPPDSIRCEIERQVTSALKSQGEFFAANDDLTRKLDSYLRPYGEPPDPITPRGHQPDWTSISRQDCFRAGGPRRFDAEFFRSGYELFDRKCQTLGRSFLLGEAYHLSPGRGVKRGSDPVPFVKQGALTNYGINWSAVLAEEGQSVARGRVRKGDILLACTAHEIYYVGRKVDFVRDVPRELALNECVADVMVIRPREDAAIKLPGSYVAAFLRRSAGLFQVQRCIRGLRGGHVYKEDLARWVRIPIPDDEWLLEFEHLASCSENKRNHAKEEMLNAISATEKWVASLAGEPFE
jgi:hypothetical protein